MLIDTYLINNFNTTIFNHGYLNRTILLENIMGQTGGFDYNIESRSFQLFLGMFNKELYPIGIQMVDIETRLKFEIKDPRLDRLLEEILAKSCLNMIVFCMNTNEIPIELSFWELSIFCYLRYITKVLGIAIDELLERPIVDWLVIEKEKYLMLEGYLMSGFEKMKERGREFIDTINEIFGEF